MNIFDIKRSLSLFNDFSVLSARVFAYLFAWPRFPLKCAALPLRLSSWGTIQLATCSPLKILSQQQFMHMIPNGYNNPGKRKK